MKNFIPSTAATRTQVDSQKFLHVPDSHLMWRNSFCNDVFRKPLRYRLGPHRYLDKNAFTDLPVLWAKSVTHWQKCKGTGNERQSSRFFFGGGGGVSREVVVKPRNMQHRYFIDFQPSSSKMSHSLRQRIGEFQRKNYSTNLTRTWNNIFDIQ